MTDRTPQSDDETGGSRLRDLRASRYEPLRMAADPQDDTYGDEADRPPRRRNWTGTVVVLLGLSAFGGTVWYAYSQGKRAGTETVAPILRADPAPTKIKPDQPGGLQVPHQDKLVYDRLTPATGAPGVERLLPPPEEPLQRTQETPTPPPEVAELPAAEPVPEPEPPASAAVTELPEEPVPAAPAPSAAPPQTQAPVTPPPVAAAPRTVPATPPPAAVTPVPPPQSVPAQSTPVQSAPAPPTPAGPSVRLQVAAVDSQAKADAEWARLKRRFPSELGSLDVRVQRADLGSRGIFFRVQAGPVQEAQAERICATLKSQNTGCIIVRN